MTLDAETMTKLEYPLRHYLKNIFVEVTDFKKVILNREKIASNLYKYPCPGQDIYLNDECYAVTYDRQKIIDQKYYYKFTDDNNIPEDMAYEYVTTYEWLNKSLPHLDDE